MFFHFWVVYDYFGGQWLLQELFLFTKTQDLHSTCRKHLLILFYSSLPSHGFVFNSARTLFFWEIAKPHCPFKLSKKQCPFLKRSHLRIQLHVLLLIFLYQLHLLVIVMFQFAIAKMEEFKETISTTGLLLYVTALVGGISEIICYIKFEF